MTTLGERVRLAAAHPPLSTCAPAAAHELDAVLERAAGFDDLPGKWQAALLEAEAAAAGAAPAPGGCCHGTGPA